MTDQPPPCIHADGTTLCPACQAQYDLDPVAWLEYGDHPAGLERWRAVELEIAEAQALQRNLEAMRGGPVQIIHVRERE